MKNRPIHVLEHMGRKILDIKIAHGRWVSTRGKSGEQADLSGIDLSGYDLEMLELGKVVFRGANLEGANLKRSDLRGADFKGANLRYACFAFARIDKDTNFFLPKQNPRLCDTAFFLFFIYKRNCPGKITCSKRISLRGLCTVFAGTAGDKITFLFFKNHFLCYNVIKLCLKYLGIYICPTKRRATCCFL